MRIVQLMNSRAGRAARVLAGLALIGTGAALGGTGGLVLAVAMWALFAYVLLQPLPAGLWQ